ncbi:MAG: NVEALA domain-containing protein, partial [Prevotellaceae bacterium]|nr:NVEALA domain-containing protein [Prevotellaceae bacterium]
KIFGAAIVAAIVLASGWNISRSMNETTLSDMALENVEALAQESSGLGTLYGNQAGTLFCCCPGTNSCGAAHCSGC